MRLYVSAGEPAEALRHYKTLELRLREDLDEEPSEETRKIAKRFLSVEPTVRRDIPIASPRSEADASLSLLQSREVRLPLILTRFFGRESEIERLQELFKQRLITLTGPGGCGKTRLAVEAIRRFSEGYNGRVLFVPLVDLSSPDEIPATIRKVLRLPNLAAAPAEMELTAALGTLPTVLLLDNLEHLLPVDNEADSARRFVSHLLEQVLSLTVVVTSRQPLGLAGEQEFPIQPLPTPPVEDPPPYVVPEDVMQFACIQLFADRARLKPPDFQITLKNVKTIAAICRRLDGIPLALELAAGLTRVLPPEAMLRRLRETLEALVSRQKNAPERHEFV
jgi:predicted ATPase